MYTWNELGKINMDFGEQLNQSYTNAYDRAAIEMTIIEATAFIILPNISIQRSSESVLTELNRNMTMAVLPVTVFIGIEAIVGLFGNILILLIYSKKYERSNFRYFVLSMAVIDLTSCCTTLPGEIFSQMNWYNYQYGWICKLKSYFNVLTAWGAASILLSMAFDRYRKVCRTLAWQIQPSLARKLCGASVVMAALVAAPIAVLWGKQTYVLEEDSINITVSICEKSEEYANGIYPFLYICLVYIVPIGVMVIVVSCLNIMTARSLFGDKTLAVYNKNSKSSTSVSTIATTIEPVIPVTSQCRDFNQTSFDVNPTTQTISNDSVNGSKGDNQPKNMDSKRDSVVMTLSKMPECLSIDNCTDEENDGQTLKDVVDLHEISLVLDDIKTRDQVVNNKSVNSSKSLSSKLGKDIRKKRKTVIMLILTSFFLITTSLYVILITFVAEKDGILKKSSNSEKVVFFFFWRLYFMNTIVNPILYGLLDPRFRSGLRTLLKVRLRSRKT